MLCAETKDEHNASDSKGINATYSVGDPKKYNANEKNANYVIIHDNRVSARPFSTWLQKLIDVLQFSNFGILV